MSGAANGRGAPEPTAPPRQSRVDAAAAVDRYVIGMRESALADRGAVSPPEGVLVITDEGRGVAAAVAERLRTSGARTAVVRLEGADVAAEGVYAADIADPVQAQALLDRIREAQGRIGGIVHLLPLREVPPVPELSADALDRHVSQEVKGFFHLVRGAAKDLTSVPGAWVWTCLSFGASPEDGGLPVPEHPWRGGLVGVVKTVAVEWPEVVAKSLALDGSSVDQTVERILEETAGPGDEHEVYYRGPIRLVPEPHKVPLETGGEPLALGPEDVVLLVGGARGITAEVACEMAREARATLLLVGRSAWPEAESAVTAGATGDAELRRVLFAHLEEQGQQPSPIEVDRAARRILREREMREARSQMEAAGSRVVYYQADLRDEAATQELLSRIYETHGRLDGVVYGAGVIEDKLIPDKTSESFDRVFDTKVRAVFHLARAIRPEGLKFFVMFSSVAGWTGNRGQVDYVAANEVLNRTALHLSARWGRRVVAVDWGPWDKAGMVTSETRRQFLARGVALVTPEAGRRFMLDEIRHGASAPPIVAAMGRLDEEEAASGAGVTAPADAAVRQ